MNDYELIQKVKEGDHILTDENSERTLQRISGRVCAAFGLLEDISEGCFGGSRLDGLFIGKADKAAASLEWMKLNYESVMYALNAAVELLDDASTDLVDLPIIHAVKRV